MHKIKKGIKKKIKGKKSHKNDELFTEEELEQYKREKEEQARRLAEQQEQEQEQQEEEEEAAVNSTEVHQEHSVPVEGAAAATEEENQSEGGDWRNFLAATDTVLKQTTDNLVHIKESSYFQGKKPAESSQAASSSAPAPDAAVPQTQAAPAKKWVDLDKGGIDDEEQVEEENQPKPEPEPEPEPELAPLQFIEDLPEVDVDDFADDFDTTFVDNVESGQVKLHYIPESPTETDPNEPDPFDTSVVDKVLHTEEEKQEKGKVKPGEAGKPAKKPKKLVSLGCAVEVLTGTAQNVDKPTPTASATSKRRRVVKKEINLLADVDDQEEGTEDTEAEDKTEDQSESNQVPEESNILDDILCIGDLDAELPEVGVVLCPTPRGVSPAPSPTPAEGKEPTSVTVNDVCEGENNKEIDLSEFLDFPGDDQDSKETKPDNGKDLDLKDLVAEFDIIDKSEVSNETLVVAEPDPIDDEFDAEFAFLAEESVAKQKDKDLEDLDNDIFDTSVAAQVLGTEETVEKDPFDVDYADEVIGEDNKEKVKPTRPAPPRPALPKPAAEAALEDVDPFDTSVADKHLEVDPFASPEAATSLPDTLQPQPKGNQADSDNFDPFDTSIAESFGKTELKVLEAELLSASETVAQSSIKKSDSDNFDFDPRAGEESTAAPAGPAAPCLLTNDNEETAAVPVLAPSNAQDDDFDPFDTSIAAKVEIQSLEAELLNQPDQIQQIGEQHKQAPPRPLPVHATTPADQTSAPKASSEIENLDLKITEFDPFDTSIADKVSAAELRSTGNQDPTTGEVARSKALELPVKPLRPPSPKCLLATTPLDDKPLLQPVLGVTTTDNPEDLSEDFDPFDTSIAEQFGKTELKVLESELLVAEAPKKVEEDDDFDPRGAEAPRRPPPPRPSRPSSPAVPQCLLTASPARTPTEGEILLPSEIKLGNQDNEIDPFDTTIAEKFGKTELRHLESELLSAKSPVTDTFDNFDPRGEEAGKTATASKPPKPSRPLPPPSHQCLLATTPTDTSAPLQPSLHVDQGPLEGTTPEDFDPFDTSIADKFGKTEIKVLEETFLEKPSEANKSVIPGNFDPFDISGAEEFADSGETNTTAQLPTESADLSADRFFASSPTPELCPTLQPVADLSRDLEEPDPFDTSIAEKFGKTELKTLESELLSDSGTKRNLSDDEFDPRAEDRKTPRRPTPPQKPPTPVHLLDSADDHNISDQPLEVIQPTSAVNDIGDNDPFDTSIAADIAPSKAELKYLETELLSEAQIQDPFDTSNIA